MTNCITVNEPYATAMIFGFQPFDDRGFEIKKGECIIQVGKKVDLSFKKTEEYFRGLGANVTADLFKMNNDKDILETENLYIDNDGVQLKDCVDLQSNDLHMAESLFFRNSKADRSTPFLLCRRIGTVVFTHSEELKGKKKIIRNYCEKNRLFDLKNSTFGIGGLGQYDVSH